MSDTLALTTVTQPVQQLGELAAEVLLAQLEDPGATPPPRLLATRLIVRGSSRPLRD